MDLTKLRLGGITRLALGYLKSDPTCRIVQHVLTIPHKEGWISYTGYGQPHVHDRYGNKCGVGCDRPYDDQWIPKPGDVERLLKLGVLEEEKVIQGEGTNYYILKLKD